MILDEWARTWAVSDSALADLKARVLNLDGGLPGFVLGTSEAAVQSAVRVEASRAGLRLFRNNVGAFTDPASGSFVRYGLANDSASVNKVLKSADLIGIRPRIIQPQDVGSRFGQFVSFECKRSGWAMGNSDRERAQLNWATFVLSMGGDARFITGPRQI
jgi:hypothetical protein